MIFGFSMVEIGNTVSFVKFCDKKLRTSSGPHTRCGSIIAAYSSICWQIALRRGTFREMRSNSLKAFKKITPKQQRVKLTRHMMIYSSLLQCQLVIQQHHRIFGIMRGLFRDPNWSPLEIVLPPPGLVFGIIRYLIFTWVVLWLATVWWKCGRKCVRMIECRSWKFLRLSQVPCSYCGIWI